MVSYLHCTLRKALALAVLLSPLSATHKYSPESSLRVSSVNISPLPTTRSSLVQVIAGAGIPDAEQWNVAVSPSVTVWFVGNVVRTGATATKNK